MIGRKTVYGGEMSDGVSLPLLPPSIRELCVHV